MAGKVVLLSMCCLLVFSLMMVLTVADDVDMALADVDAVGDSPLHIEGADIRKKRSPNIGYGRHAGHNYKYRYRHASKPKSKCKLTKEKVCIKYGYKYKKNCHHGWA